LLRDALGLSREQIGYVSALFSTSAALMAILSGRWADRWGVRALLIGVQVVGGLALTATTIDHVTGGRFCLNVVCGWFKDEFEMFGAAWRDHDVRYAYAAE
jgi:MFS family permease